MKAELLFLLIAAHCVCDFSLQSGTMAREKRRASTTELQAKVPWFWWLAAHAVIQGLGVLLVTRSLPLALAETGAHFVIDFGKGEGWYGMAGDQGLHLACKLCWWGLA